MHAKQVANMVEKMADDHESGTYEIEVDSFVAGARMLAGHVLAAAEDSPLLISVPLENLAPSLRDAQRWQAFKAMASPDEYAAIELQVDRELATTRAIDETPTASDDEPVH